MAVVATLTKGYDLDYIWRQVDRGLAKHVAGYYIQASESGGEPSSRWWGPGAEAFGFQLGKVIECEPYDLLFGERKALDGTPLGQVAGHRQAGRGHLRSAGGRRTARHRRTGARVAARGCPPGQAEPQPQAHLGDRGLWSARLLC